MMRRAAALVVACLAGLLPSPVRAADSEVTIRSNFYTPSRLDVDPGDTVTWRLLEGAHTVTSGRFDSGLMQSVGEAFSFTAPDEDTTIVYNCKRHLSMRGAIVVGTGGTPPAEEVSVRTVPSESFPTLGAALEGLRATERYRIDLAPGAHPGGLALAKLDALPGQTRFPDFELTIRGTGATPADVVLDGTGKASALLVRVDGVKVSNLTVRGGSYAPLQWQNVERFGAQDVVVEVPGRYGLRGDRSRYGILQRVSVDGASVAGVSLVGCGTCDTVVDEVSVSNSLQGLSAENAGALLVRRSTFTDNGAGISLKTTADTTAPLRGSHIVENTITDSTNRSIPAPPVSASLDLPVGAGVWLEGASHVTVERNSISTSSFGVVITGPTLANRVIDNALSNSLEADLAWDGAGAQVCFSGNGAGATSMPPGVQTIYACDLPATAGVPFPLVWTTLLGWGLD